MEAKSPLVVTAGILSGLALALLCVSAALLWDGHSLRRQLAASRAETTQLRAQQAATEGDLAAQRAQLDALAAELEEVRQVAAAQGDPPATTPDARRVRVYAGDRMVGLGWVLPSPAGATNGDSTIIPSANVVLDVPPGALTGGSIATADTGATSPAPGHAYYYRYNSYPYWPYFYTTGWIEWPGCTNSPTFSGGVSPPPSNLPPAGPPIPPVTPAPTVASVPRPSPAAFRARFAGPAPGTVYPRTTAIPRSAQSQTVTRMAPMASTTMRGNAPATYGQRAPLASPTGVSVGTRR